MSSCCPGPRSSNTATPAAVASPRAPTGYFGASLVAGTAVHELERLLVAEGLPAQDLAAPGRHLFRFTDADGALAGFGGIELHGGDALIRSIVVPMLARGRGYGRAIAETLLDEAGRRGATVAYLLTTAEAYFGRLGFVPVDQAVVPPAVAATSQFASLCPASATVMRKPIAREPRASAPGELPVAVIGGGPVGLAAAAHLLERGLEPVVFEAGPSAGTAALAWGHVAMFSSWRYDIDKAARALLERHGWQAPAADAFPTGRDLVEDYLAPLATLPEIAGRLRLGTEVTGIARIRAGKVRTAGRELAPFEVRFRDGDGREGRLLARAVVVASGTWGNPSPAGASGLPALGEREAAARIRYRMPDVLGAERDRYAGRRVLVVGSGHSAIGTLIDLATLAGKAPGTAVLWVARSSDLTRAYRGGDADQLPERGALGARLRRLVETGAVRLLAPFAVEEIERGTGGALLVRDADGCIVEADEMVVATGLRPDLGLLRETRLDLDPALECPRVLAPLIDPNLHSCGTVRPHGAEELAQPDAGLFLAGMVSYGRAPTFLLATGYEQVRSIAAFLAGDIEAARRVELDLPQTGVCSADRVLPDVATGTASCCAPETPQRVCCPPKPELRDDEPCCGAREPVLAEPAE